MAEKLKDYQVIDVLCGGTFYKVRHKVTNNIFAWKAYNCAAFSANQIQNVVNEVKTISKITTENLLKYYDTILHAPSKTLYFVLEYNSWRSVQELVEVSKVTDKFFAEGFIWHLLLDLARVCKLVDDLHLLVLQKCLSVESIFVNEGGELRFNCFELATTSRPNLMRQVGDVLHTLCYRTGEFDRKIKDFHYSDDLSDVVTFLTDDKNVNLRPDVVLYHPTILANIETQCRPTTLADILVSAEYTHLVSEANKCDSQKAVEMCRAVEPAPRKCYNLVDSPIYCNLSPKVKLNNHTEDSHAGRGSLSPTLAALALELPGFVPRSRKPYSAALDNINCPQQISEETLSQQWMTRLIALRQREVSLNKRERDLIAKEIVNSPAAKIIPLKDSCEDLCPGQSNGITLPAVIGQAACEKGDWVSRRHHRRATSLRARPRRKSYAYEDLDSSLSADAGDGSIIVTSTKFTKENMPRRTIFPDVSTKKVHFTSSNPFAESDESVTLTFYELENVDPEGYQVPRREEKIIKDLSKFKYLDVEKVTTEKRVAKTWNHSSPSKQAKFSKSIFSDITNTGEGIMRKTPSKTSLTSKCSSSSRFSMSSVRSQWSVDSSASKVCESVISDKGYSSIAETIIQTPVALPDMKKSKRKSLLPFKTPFKFNKTSTKV
ncbi:unnamed protein product [Chilo suppressalis]|uniref:non-specific serine/threonine protein kinase n=1 Tax=Chilo suppressalis TaxID=168631 RepID=A0ABN8APE2_CHISP|nr:unnamed protein product [Chilo suppressalis]